MKFRISKEKFVEGLAQVQSVVSSRATLPILSNVLLEVEGGKLKMTTTDLDVVISGEPAMLRVIAWCMNLRSRLTGIATGDHALFMTRAAFDAAGGFPDQPLMEDIAMCKRLKRASRPACLTAKVTTSGRRWEQRGVWRTIGLMWRLRLAYFLGASPEYLAARYR